MYQVILYVPKKPTTWGDLVTGGDRFNHVLKGDSDPYSWEDPEIAAESTAAKFWNVFLGPACHTVAEGLKRPNLAVPGSWQKVLRLEGPSVGKQ